MNFIKTNISSSSRSVLAGLLAVLATSSFAQLTDIANAPLTNGGAVPIKPNIMLLLDTSNSMRRTHMPDELENTAADLSLGYRAYQCNILYYNPTQVYQLPKQADGTNFPTPSFTAARYNGFDSLSALVDLSNAFQAFDNATRQNSVGADSPQMAYYYLHSSGQTFVPTEAPCTDADTGVSKPATTSPGGVSGNWVRVTVSATSGPGMSDERQNFAIWYSYYRTRINLAKSAISLAFTPLNDSYRVGFLTVLPTTALAGTGSVDSAYYLPIKDFSATQRADWFSKLFAQVPRGSSPARQALARVGRHYAGQTDGINDGMPEDPVQYSCQQNFTIATTDGYWNSGAEPVGPVRIDGTTLVGQQDGTLTPPTGNSPRPIWDGEIDNTQIITDKNNTYAYAPCTGSWFLRSTSQINSSTSQVLRSTSQIQRSTNQILRSSLQRLRSTQQNLQSTAQTTQSTSQINRSTIQRLQSTNQNLQSTEQTRRSTLQRTLSTQQILVTSTQVRISTSQTGRAQTQRIQRIDRIVQTSVQNRQSTTQNLRSTTQNLRSTTQVTQTTTQDLLTRVQATRSTAQITRSTSQNVQSTSQNLATSTQTTLSTTQNLLSTSQNLQSTAQNLASTSRTDRTQTQVRQSTLQILSCSAITELCTPVASCTAGGVITCSNVTTGPTLVASCTPATATAGNSYVTTTCASTVTGPTPVQTCTPEAATAANSFTTTTCTPVTTGPTAVSTCTATAADAGNSWTTTTCSTNNTGPTAVSSCTPVTATAGNSWVTTTCSTNNTGPTAVSSCTPVTATAGNSWVTTACSTNNTGPTGVSSCTPSSATAGNSWITTTCANPSATNYTNSPVGTCTAQTGGSANGWQTITCSTNSTGPTVVASCTPQTASGANSWTTTTCSTNTTGPTGVSSCTAITANAGNSWTTTSCGNNNTGPTGVSSCTPSPANASNSWTQTTCANNDVSDLPVQTCTPQTGSAVNGWATITCSQDISGPTPVSSCTPVAETAANDWKQTTCANNNTTNVAVSSCTASSATAGNSWTTTTCSTNNTTNVPVSSCTASSATAGNSWTTTTCSTNNTTNVPVSSCTPITATAGNGWTTTTCDVTGPNNYTNVPVASCTPQTATAGNSWVTITCSSFNVQPPTATNCSVGTTLGPGPDFDSTQCYDAYSFVPNATCTPQTGSAANNWVTIVCSVTVTTGPTPVASCTPATASAANSWTTTTCDYPSATNFVNRATGSCTPQTGAPANDWVTVTCPSPITTGPTAVQTCTPVAANAGNSWTTTTCNNVTSGPTAVNPATCALGAGRSTVTTSGTTPDWIDVTCAANDTASVAVATCTAAAASAINGWTAVTCPSPVVTTNVPVASCTSAVASAGNSWTTTTCPTSNTTGPTPVASCTAVSPVSANSFTETTCSTATTGPVGVASCSAAVASAGNSWTTTSCGTNNTTNVPVASCTASVGSAANAWLTTTCPTPVTTGPTPVGSCTSQTATAANSWTTTTCDTTSGSNNYTNVGVASCVPQTAAAGNNWVTITCPSPVVTTNVPVASCSPEAASSSNSFTTTTCNTATTGPTGVAPGTCTAATASSANSFTSTTCTLNNNGPTPVASCTAASATAANSFVATTCNTVTTGPSLTLSCTPAVATASNSFTETTCPSAPGQKVQYVTTTSLTTTQFSGGVVVGSPSVSSSTGAATDLDTACYVAGVDSLPPLPNPGKPGTTWTNGFGTNVSIAPTPPTPCTSWPCTANSNSLFGGAANTLADVAQYYYVTDLRPTLQNNVPATGTAPEDDRATWQHMTTFTIGLGVSGLLNYRNDYRSLSTTVGDFADIRTGVKNWTIPAADQPTSIDDFWHAAVNGRGLYFSAGSPSSVIQGLTAALAGVTARTGAGSAAAPSSQKPSDGDNLTYIATYVTQKWTGELEAREIDLTTGGPKPTQIWSAKTKLDAKVGNACDNRRIFLFRQGATNNMTPFTWNTRACDGAGAPTGVASTGLNASEQAFFDATRASLLSQYTSMTDGSSGSVDQRTPAAGASLLNFIRGQRGNEDFLANTAGRLYRKRDTVLADIVNSQPAYVRRATANYGDPGYENFVATSASRIPMVYVGSNSGMLHAFRAGTGPTDTDGGVEEWAFVPTQVLPNLYKLADTNYASSHNYYVDGSPAAFDAYDSANATWKKILVAGLRAGGKGYYALDVTDPLNPRALWEFNWSNTCYDGTTATSGADCHIGFTFGTPTYAKLSDGTWVVLVSSGYNNVNSPAKTGDGQGYLYVLNAFTGRIIYKISTGYGTATAPSGLGYLAVYTDDPTIDVTALQVYGADLAGNVWRFDINDRIAPAGRDASLVAVAKAPDGTRQPISTALNLLEQDGKPYIVIGTGRLLGATDLSDTQRQSIYVFADYVGTSISNLRTVLAPQVQTQVGADDDPNGYRTISCTASVLCGSADGWYSDLPSNGERLVVDPKVQKGTLKLATSILSASACTVGGIGKDISVNVLTGNPIPGTNGRISKGYLPSLPVGVTILQLPGGAIVAVIADAAGGQNVLPFPVVQPGPQGKRITWRELTQ